MTTLLSLLFFLGFYILYSTSGKITYHPSALQIWLRQKPALAKFSGCSLLILGFFAFCLLYGLGAGILTAMVLLMMASGLIIILSPLKIINMKMIILICILSFILELSIH